mgnify:CR=1 FL=1
MANPAEPISGQICWPSPGSFTGHQRAHQLAARGQKLLAIDSPYIKTAPRKSKLNISVQLSGTGSVHGESMSIGCGRSGRACPLLRAEEGMFMGYQAGGRKCLPLMSRGGHVHSSVRRKGMSQGLGDRGEGMSTRRCQGRACPKGRQGMDSSLPGQTPDRPQAGPGGPAATGTAPAGRGGAGPGGLPWLPRRGGVR